MKSTLTYEMHNYAAASPPLITETKRAKKRSSSSDSNNNKRSEKYSLRQRQKRKIATTKTFVEDPQEYNSDYSTNEQDALSPSDTSSLHSSTPKRERSSTTTTASSSKAKPKAAPLSKYRRKTANARERTRMREINTAFETLRHCMPAAIIGEDAGSTNEKLTKITTLRLAMKYISTLSEALANPNENYGLEFLLECEPQSSSSATASVVSFATEEYVETITKSTAKTTTKTTKSPSKSKGSTVKKSTTKRQTKKQKPQQSTNIVTPNYKSQKFMRYESSSSSAYASLSSPEAASPIPGILIHSAANPLPEQNNAMPCIYANQLNTPLSDLSSIILESDGESLHLSEHCLSPLQSNYSKLFGSTELIESLQKPSQDHCFDVQAIGTDNIDLVSLENPLELSLRLLDSNNDSLDFNVDHQPSSCISPLVTLDPCNPFSDLLQSDFPEQSAFDLFLT